jgi:hypothetical protein
MVWKTKAEKLAEQKLKEEQVDQEISFEPTRDSIATLETENKVKQSSPKTKKPNEFDDEYDRVDVLADYDPGADIFRIPRKDPHYAYRFLRDEPKNLSIKTNQLLYQQGGWQVVQRAHNLRIGIRENFLSPDGTYRIGGHILAFMPQELFEKKEAAKLKKTTARIDQVNRHLKEGDPSVGGREMHKSMRGIQPAHKLGMGPKDEE